MNSDIAILHLPRSDCGHTSFDHHGEEENEVTEAKSASAQAAYSLGLAGLIPFIAGSAGMFIFPELKFQLALPVLLYGAVILSFLGGIAWGFAVLSPAAGMADYGLSVMPSLIAWAAALEGNKYGMAALSTAIALWFVVEGLQQHNATIPRWYWRLRLILTAGASLSLAMAAMAW